MSRSLFVTSCNAPSRAPPASLSDYQPLYFFFEKNFFSRVWRKREEWGRGRSKCEDIVMSRLVYRGVCYDQEDHKKTFLKWWNSIHCDASRWLIYRGQRYRAIRGCLLSVFQRG